MLYLKTICGKGQSEQGNYSTDHQHCGRLRSAKYPVGIKKQNQRMATLLDS